MSYVFEPIILEPELEDTADWRGLIYNDEGYIVLEVWNSGDQGGNFYIWQDYDARWEIEHEALQNYSGDDNAKMEQYREAGITAPMDAWIEELRNAQGEEQRTSTLG